MEHVVYKRYPLGNKRFNWRQREFALSTFSAIGPRVNGDPREVLDRNIRYLKEAGFNMTELGWACHDGAWAAVEACERHGLDLVFQDMSIMGGMQHNGLDNKVAPEVPRALVNALRDKKHVIGYYVWDEPYGDEQFTEARRQMDMLEELAPDALLFTVAVPDYNLFGEDGDGYRWENGRFAPYVDEFIARMDPPVLSFDYYPVGDYFGAWPGHRYSYENQLDDTFMWLDLALFRKKAREHALPLWFYYQGCQLFACEDTDKFVFPMVRAFMYAGALYGAKGLQHYQACDRDDISIVNPAGEKGRFFEDQREIHREFAALGNTLMALESTLVYHSDELLPGNSDMRVWCDGIADSTLFTALPRRCSVGEFADGYGNKYVMILNRDYEKPLRCEIPMKGEYRLYEVSKVDGTQSVNTDKTNTLRLDLMPGDAILLRVQNAKEEPFTCEYVLAE